MVKANHYPKAPITEAIIDLRVQLADSPSHALLNIGDGAELADYTNRETMLEAVGQMAVGRLGGSASVQQREIGWKLTSIDQKQIVQSRMNGFTFSRLAPYDRWNSFRDEAKRLWNVYRQKVKPTMVERLAVRYINRIDIPGVNVDLKDYFRTSPELAPELPQQLEGYFMQLRLPYPKVSGLCVINQTIVPPPSERIVSIVLDIDLFRSQSVPQADHEIWAFFETLHDSKNEVFESCITDLTRKMFV